MNKNLVIFIVASLGIYGGWAWWMHKNYPPLPAGSLAAQKKRDSRRQFLRRAERPAA